MQAFKKKYQQPSGSSSVEEGPGCKGSLPAAAVKQEPLREADLQQQVTNVKVETAVKLEAPAPAVKVEQCY